MGLPFFAPMFNPQAEIVIHCPEIPGDQLAAGAGSAFPAALFADHPAGHQGPPQFPACWPRAAAADAIRLDNGIEVAHVLHDSHPRLGVLIYRIARAGAAWSTPPMSKAPRASTPGIRAFIAGADLLVHDSQYLERDYFSATDPRNGYGHSTVSMAVRNAVQCGVKRLFLFHFDPRYSDPVLEEMLAQARENFPNTVLAQEGKKIKIRR